MNKPRRVQLKRVKGWRKPKNTVVVSRPSKWGNPYSLQSYKFGNPDGSPAPFDEDAARDMAVRDFEAAIGLYIRYERQDIRRELRGKNLACYCPLDKVCHADVLLEIANEPSAMMEMSPRAVRTFRTVSLACQRRGMNSLLGFQGLDVRELRGVHQQSLDLLVRRRLLSRHRNRYRTTALGDHEERLFLELRFEAETRFQCSRCGVMTRAVDGGCDDEFDPNGDYCSKCWCQEKHNIERVIAGF